MDIVLVLHSSLTMLTTTTFVFALKVCTPIEYYIFTAQCSS